RHVADALPFLYRQGNLLPKLSRLVLNQRYHIYLAGPNVVVRLLSVSEWHRVLIQLRYPPPKHLRVPKHAADWATARSYPASYARFPPTCRYVLSLLLYIRLLLP